MTKTPQTSRRGFAISRGVVLSPADGFAYDYVPTATDAPKTDGPKDEVQRQPASEPKRKAPPKPEKVTQPKPPKGVSADSKFGVQVRLAVSPKVESLSKTLGPSFTRELASALSEAINAEIKKNGCRLEQHPKVTAGTNTVRCTVYVTPEVEQILRADYGQLAEKALQAMARRLGEATIATFLKTKGIA